MQTEKLLKEISALDDMIGVIAERFDGADRIIDAMLREMMAATNDMKDILGVQA